jgi:hypothetical protein
LSPAPSWATFSSHMDEKVAQDSTAGDCLSLNDRQTRSAPRAPELIAL